MNTQLSLNRILAIVAPVLGIRSIETDRDHLWIKLRATPTGLPEALSKLRRNGAK